MLLSPSQPDWRFDRGGDVITSSSGTVVGRWRGLQAMGTGCTLAAGTVAADLTGTLSGLVVPAGVTVHARLTAVQLTSGTAVAYL